MRMILIGFLVLPATAFAQNAGEEAPWVCVPTREYGWVCGRGARAPEPRPLPQEPAPEPAAPPGYVPPEGSAAEALLPEITEEVLEAEAGTEPSPARPPREARARAPAARTEPAGPEPRQTAVTGPQYGIQLIAVRDPDTLDEFIARPALQGLPTYRRSWEDAEGTWYVLLTGRFPSAAQAAAALESLPRSLQQAGAWVRRVDTLQP